MKILAVSGSPRLKGNTVYLSDEALSQASKLRAKTPHRI
jgi:multimeric flavodoxin WrbA